MASAEGGAPGPEGPEGPADPEGPEAPEGAEAKEGANDPEGPEDEAEGEAGAPRPVAPPAGGGARPSMKRSAGGNVVTLHIYDVFGYTAVKHMNNVTSLLGTGAFHTAVEVFGVEWSYGYIPDPENTGLTGIFWCLPGECEAHGYRENIHMGNTSLTESQVNDLLDELRGHWKSQEYDMLRQNCCHFSDALCVRLGVGHMPAWINNLAAAGATVGDGLKQLLRPLDAVHSAAIVAAAKAGDFDEKYQISGTVTAPGRAIIAALQDFEGKLEEGVNTISNVSALLGKNSGTDSLQSKDVGQADAGGKPQERRRCCARRKR